MLYLAAIAISSHNSHYCEFPVAKEQCWIFTAVCECPLSPRRPIIYDSPPDAVNQLILCKSHLRPDDIDWLMFSAGQLLQLFPLVVPQNPTPLVLPITLRTTLVRHQSSGGTIYQFCRGRRVNATFLLCYQNIPRSSRRLCLEKMLVNYVVTKFLKHLPVISRHSMFFSI